MLSSPLPGAVCGPSGAGQQRPTAPPNDPSAAGIRRLIDSVLQLHQFLRNKRQEWEEYRSEVTPFELRKNLQVL
ncbi:hypothetical protein [Kitasatospora sp. NPDC051702]|uniref:hypothetical protein n=1 Tax=Kitasatospora sp. NPDC051702 TaxID=3155672 RepID=UPI0034366D08